jgi:hypothetical protein
VPVAGKPGLYEVPKRATDDGAKVGVEYGA